MEATVDESRFFGSLILDMSRAHFKQMATDSNHISCVRESYMNHDYLGGITSDF